MATAPRLRFGLGLPPLVVKLVPVNIVPPVVTGAQNTGSTLTATTGTWTGAFAYNYQWCYALSSRLRLRADQIRHMTRSIAWPP